LTLRPPRDGLPLLASAGGDKTVRFWQPTIGRMVRFARLPSAPLAIDWTPDGERLLAACEDGHLRIIDADSAKVSHDVEAIDGWAYVALCAPDGASAFIAGEARQMRRIELPSAE
jgi:WD40 repeat protein